MDYRCLFSVPILIVSFADMLSFCYNSGLHTLLYGVLNASSELQVVNNNILEHSRDLHLPL